MEDKITSEEKNYTTNELVKMLRNKAMYEGGSEWDIMHDKNFRDLLTKLMTQATPEEIEKLGDPNDSSTEGHIFNKLKSMHDEGERGLNRREYWDYFGGDAPDEYKGSKRTWQTRKVYPEDLGLTNLSKDDGWSGLDTIAKKYLPEVHSWTSTGLTDPERRDEYMEDLKDLIWDTRLENNRKKRQEKRMDEGLRNSYLSGIKGYDIDTLISKLTDNQDQLYANELKDMYINELKSRVNKPNQEDTKQVTPQIKDLDTNKNGKIEKDELDAYTKDLNDYLDKNPDAKKKNYY